MKKRKELFIVAPTRPIAANIGGATIYEAIEVDDSIKKQEYLAKSPWQNRLTLSLDKISIVFLKLLLTIDMRLSQIKGKTNNNTAILGGLA